MERVHAQPSSQPPAMLPGTKDGRGAGDHDEAFRFGYRPSVRWTYPFSVSQYSRLLILRGRVQDGEYAADLGDGTAA
ncbi:MAG TPA: hypothetical protein VK066_24260 [Chloroflexota bacterium]|nr:hypothetical protein [Chloroflexota bacterium]